MLGWRLYASSYSLKRHRKYGLSSLRLEGRARNAGVPFDRLRAGFRFAQ